MDQTSKAPARRAGVLRAKAFARVAPDPQTARAVVDQASETIATGDSCMLAVPAAIACADIGDFDDARRHLAVAERFQQLWEGTSWQAAILEARAHLTFTEGDADRADALLDEVALLFDQARQPLDAARCRAGLVGTRTSAIANR